MREGEIQAGAVKVAEAGLEGVLTRDIIVLNIKRGALTIEQASDALARELAGYISTEVNRLGDLVTEFLDFARPLHAEPHPANLIAHVVFCEVERAKCV